MQSDGVQCASDRICLSDYTPGPTIHRPVMLYMASGDLAADLSEVRTDFTGSAIL